MKAIFLLILSSVVLWAHTAQGYEVATHGAITKHAYDNSELSSSSVLLDKLGLRGIDADKPFGAKYYDVAGAEVQEREQKQFENGIIEKDLDEESLSVKGWMMQGAIREDDIKSTPCKKVPDNPLDDPHPKNRPINHFYNSVDDRGLNAGITGAKAMDWGFGVQDAFAQPPVVNTTRDNHYTLADAREAMGSKRGHSDYFPAHQLPSSHVLT
jgi:hypothetical protein